MKTYLCGMRHWVIPILLLIAGQVNGQLISDYRIDTLLAENWNPQFPCISQDGSQLLFTLGENPQVYQLDLSSKSITQITQEADGTGAACFSPDEKQIVFVALPQRYLMKSADRGNISQLLPDREVFASTPSFNHEGNLLVFVGRRENQKGRHLFTYDFVYDNLNQLTKSTAVYWPQWSPSDELISCHEKTEKSSKIVLYHWYGKVAHILENDTVALRDAAWTASDYKIIYIGETTKKQYLFMSTKDGVSPEVLLETENHIEKPIWVAGTNKISLISMNQHGRNMLLQIDLDEQTNFPDVLTKTPYTYE